MVGTKVQMVLTAMVMVLAAALAMGTPVVVASAMMAMMVEVNEAEQMG